MNVHVQMDVSLHRQTTLYMYMGSLLSHYENLSMQYIEMFSDAKFENCSGKILIYLIILEAVRTSTHTLCFRTKVKKKFYYIKVVYKGYTFHGHFPDGSQMST